MALTLFAHPFSSYCQKALTALYENGTPFDYRLLSPDNPEAFAELAARWPIGKFPVLVDGDRTLVEATIIIEHLALDHPGPFRPLPEDPRTALAVRMLDNYVMTPMQKIVGDVIRRPEVRDPHGVAEAHALLDKAYRWLEGVLPGRRWAAGDAFTLADCAAAPSLFYADWVHPIAEQLVETRAYRARLLARPSFARAIDEARPYRPLFPPGAPDRD
ncbi:MAG TPA: glutathione S-transferase family protein [Methylomirabilota bacterium]|nr:glutathione S-transferase family protein [Methylomirabilota bacterium]